MTEVHNHCKKTFENSQCYENSSSMFQVGKKYQACEWVNLKRKPRCSVEVISETCTQTCTGCIPTLEQRVAALVMKVDQQHTKIKNLEIKVEVVEPLQTQVDNLESDVDNVDALWINFLRQYIPTVSQVYIHL